MIMQDTLALFFLLVNVALSLVQPSLVGTSVALSLVVVVVGALFLTNGWHLRLVGEHYNGPSKSLIWALIRTIPLSRLS